MTNKGQDRMGRLTHIARKTPGYAVGSATRLWSKLLASGIMFLVVVVAVGFIKILDISWLGWINTLAIFVIPILGLIFVAPPLYQLYGTVGGAILYEGQGQGFFGWFRDGLKVGFKNYWGFVRVLILWLILIPVGIKIIPIEAHPLSFYMFIPIVIGHELAYWSNWHNAPEDRAFQKWIMRILKAGILTCVALPFYFQGIKTAEEYGVYTPSIDSAGVAERKALKESTERNEQERKQCIERIHSNARKVNRALSQSDLLEMEACKALHQQEKLEKFPAMTEAQRAQYASKVKDACTAKLVGKSLPSTEEEQKITRCVEKYTRVTKALEDPKETSTAITLKEFEKFAGQRFFQLQSFAKEDPWLAVIYGIGAFIALIVILNVLRGLFRRISGTGEKKSDTLGAIAGYATVFLLVASLVSGVLLYTVYERINPETGQQLTRSEQAEKILKD